MKIKMYKVSIRHAFYYVEAPNKRIARWCGYNMYCNEYAGVSSIKEVSVELIGKENDDD